VAVASSRNAPWSRQARSAARLGLIYDGQTLAIREQYDSRMLAASEEPGGVPVERRSDHVAQRRRPGAARAGSRSDSGSAGRQAASPRRIIKNRIAGALPDIACNNRRTKKMDGRRRPHPMAPQQRGSPGLLAPLNSIPSVLCRLNRGARRAIRFSRHREHAERAVPSSKTVLEGARTEDPR